MEYVLLSLLWLGYFFLHSFAASIRVKALMEDIFGSRVYRLIYSITSTILFMLLYIYSSSLPTINLWSGNFWIRYLGLIITVFGIIILLKSFKKLSASSFLGISKLNKNQLVTSGIHSFVRHPIYSGTILIFIGFVFYTNSIQALILLITTLMYLPLGIGFEEQKLVKEFGSAYCDYKAKTPSIIPNLHRFI